jgi:hypothetical protein
MIEDLFYSMKLNIRCLFSNHEIELYRYFYKKTRVFPKIIIIIKNFIFFFVKNEDYFKAKSRVKFLKIRISNKKMMVIRREKTIIRLILAFFPDLYIHNINFTIDDKTADIIMKVIFLTDLDRLIAIGGKYGTYIKSVNQIFNEYIYPVKIECEVGNI